MPDAHANFAYSLVATAPSPANSGTSLVVTASDGAKFPAVPFNATVWPVGNLPTTGNAEIVRVTARSTDTLTITRAQESSSARTIIVGDQIAAAVTSKTLTDVENFLGCIVYGTSFATVPNTGVDTAILFDTNYYDTDPAGSMHSTLSNTNRITIQTGGYYLLFGQLYLPSNGAGTRTLKIRNQGGGTRATTIESGVTGNDMSISVGIPVLTTAASWWDLSLSVTGATGAQTITGQAALPSVSWFQAIRIGT